MAGQSQTDVCNSALQRVGAARIMDITDNSREARVCAVAYDSNRRSELMKYRWKFATKRAVLAPDVTPPAFEYQYAYTLPADCLRVLLPTDPYLDWSVEGGKVLTNTLQSPYLGANANGSVAPGSPALYLRYIADITDASQFDAIFYDMLALALAIDICEALTQSNQKKSDLQGEYKDSLAEAKRMNAFETIPTDPPDDSFWLIRYS